MKRIKFILPLIAGFMLFSCSDYLDVNSSSDNPGENLVTPNLSLAAAQSDSYRVLTQRMNEYGNVFMNNWGANVNSFTGGYAEEFGIILSNNFYDDIWDGVYRSTGEYTKIINHPAPNFENHKAIAMICKAFYMQYLVDLYGDVPYSQAHLGVNNLSPAYDNDEEIYLDLVKQCEDAVALIDNAPATARVVGSEDVILGGDMAGWKKFANTLKLRLLLRQSEVNEDYVQEKIQAMEAAGAQFVDQNITINPGYSNGSNDRQNPFYTLMYDLKEVDDPTRAARTAYRFRRASKYIADKMNFSPYDPRVARLFEPIGNPATVVGVEQGDASAAGGNGNAPADISPLGKGLIISSEQDGYMMLLSESLLLQAEAVHKGYLTGNAQDLFDSAIAASFEHLGAGDPLDYIIGVNGVVGKGYGIGTEQDQLQAIFYQKSIALNGTNGAEIFIEYTRARINGMPLIDTVDMPLNSSTPTGFKPRRLMYPVSELASNTANVPAQTVQDCYNSGPFWFAQ